MKNEAITVPESLDRRERFRSFLRLFNPSAPPQNVIAQGLICQGDGSPLFRRLVAEVEGLPGTHELIVGGIGSGKTTQLLLAEQQLAAMPSVRSIYLDVSKYTEVSSLVSGSLLASLGLRIEEELKGANQSTPVKNAIATIRKFAYGYTERKPNLMMRSLVDLIDRPTLRSSYAPLEELLKPEITVTVPGKLKPPSFAEMNGLNQDTKELINAVDIVLRRLDKETKKPVVIFDGLDRILKPDQFWSVVEQDLRALKMRQISVLIAGPLSIVYGHHRVMTDFFDNLPHHIPPIQVDSNGSSFLLEILQKRGANNFLEDAKQAVRLCQASGGVLRDLISLARSAGENAYLDDSDYVQSVHIDEAIEQLGNSYLLGLTSYQVELLNSIRSQSVISSVNEQTMELLITRRILERSGFKYEVHPAVAHVLPAQRSR